ncbi:hypothetical protein CP03DC29_1422 [Chlamydia psittaci 03DC29]|nr:hypothetical protein CP03DC29_1422 [Chlamydia psittaci 03DC29]
MTYKLSLNQILKQYNLKIKINILINSFYFISFIDNNFI